ncbi:MAG: ATP/GTP-binding protein [Candidatus Methanomethylicus sp.]|nr:ATP/GTP-binding protein [Candidatus Methanomethylicus sp.]
MKFTFLMGTAGSGKSAMTLSLAERMQSSEVDVATLNLDPGVRWLPYTPDVDIRDFINYDRLVDEYKLGPNGALVASVDAAVNHIDEMRSELEKLCPEYVIVDTPGQMELFAYRDAGAIIARTLSEKEHSIIFLADSLFLNRSSDFVSILLLSYSIQTRFRAPQINCISKVDLMPKSLYDKGILWTNDPDLLLEEFIAETPDLKSEIARRMLEALVDLDALGEFIFTSSNTGEGLDDLYAQIQRVHTGGEDL